MLRQTNYVTRMSERSPAEIKRIVVLSGPPCSGKTAISKHLLTPLDAIHLQMDEFRAGLFPNLRHHAPTIDKAYYVMHVVANLLLSSGHNVIVDASYGRYTQRKELEIVALAANATLYVIQCRVDPMVARKRFELRPSGHPATDLDPDRVALLVELYPYFSQGITIDSNIDMNMAVKTAVDYVTNTHTIAGNLWSESVRTNKRWPGPQC
jgi:predicted kinase